MRAKTCEATNEPDQKKRCQHQPAPLGHAIPDRRPEIKHSTILQGHGVSVSPRLCEPSKHEAGPNRGDERVDAKTDDEDGVHDSYTSSERKYTGDGGFRRPAILQCQRACLPSQNGYRANRQIEPAAD